MLRHVREGERFRLLVQSAAAFYDVARAAAAVRGLVLLLSLAVEGLLSFSLLEDAPDDVLAARRNHLLKPAWVLDGLPRRQILAPARLNNELGAAWRALNSAAAGVSSLLRLGHDWADRNHM